MVGVSPAHQGSGLGKALTLQGLHHLQEDRGLDTVVLYVDGTNTAARRPLQRPRLHHRRPGRPVRPHAPCERHHSEFTPSLPVINPALTRPITNQEPSAPLTPQPDGSWPSPLIHTCTF